MRLAVSGGEEKSESSDNLSHWVELPGLCCQAAGGHPEWADDLTIAWLLFYIAAHLMDKIQDQDDPDPWWRERGTGAALSAATGLFFTASLAINQLNTNSKTTPVAANIITSFNNSFLWMASGQYSDMLGPARTLQQYWDRAMAKSGSFFGLACRTGAQLATRETGQLATFERYGQHLGLLIQIKDDLDGKKVGVLESGAESLNPGYLAGFEVVKYKEILELIDGLKAQDLSAILLSLPVAINLLKENADSYNVLDEIISSQEFVIVYRKGSQLKAMIDSAIDGIKNDGTYDTIYNKWFGLVQ